MKADAHRCPASSLERTIALARPDPTTSVAILENARGAAYHWISYGCMQKYQQHRDLAPGLDRLSRGSRGAPRLAQWWRNFEDLRQAGFYGNQTGESEVQETLELLERIRTWATTQIGRFHEEGTNSSLAGRIYVCSGRRNSEPARSRDMQISNWR